MCTGSPASHGSLPKPSGARKGSASSSGTHPLGCDVLAHLIYPLDQ